MKKIWLLLLILPALASAKVTDRTHAAKVLCEAIWDMTVEVVTTERDIADIVSDSVKKIDDAGYTFSDYGGTRDAYINGFNRDMPRLRETVSPQKHVFLDKEPAGRIAYLNECIPQRIKQIK